METSMNETSISADVRLVVGWRIISPGCGAGGRGGERRRKLALED